MSWFVPEHDGKLLPLPFWDPPPFYSARIRLHSESPIGREMRCDCNMRETAGSLVSDPLIVRYLRSVCELRRPLQENREGIKVGRQASS